MPHPRIPKTRRDREPKTEENINILDENHRLAVCPRTAKKFSCKKMQNVKSISSIQSSGAQKKDQDNTTRAQ